MDAFVTHGTEESCLAALPLLHAQISGVNGSKMLRPNQHIITAPLVVGEPGIGKTSGIREFYTKLGWKVLLVSCGVANEILMFSGLPEVTKLERSAELEDFHFQQTGQEYDDGIIQVERPESVLRMDYATPDWIAATKTIPPDQRILIVFDDAHLIKGAAMMEILTGNRQSNNHVFGYRDNVAFMLVANGLEDNAGAIEMMAPVLDRCVTIRQKGANFKEWVRNFAIPRGIDPMIISFLEDNPDQFWKRGVGLDDPMDRKPGPRAWAAVSTALAGHKSLLDNPNRVVEEYRKLMPTATEDQVQNLLEILPKVKPVESQLYNIAASSVGNKTATKFSVYCKAYCRFPLKDAMQTTAPLKIAAEDLAVAVKRYSDDLVALSLACDLHLCQGFLKELPKIEAELPAKTRKSSIMQELLAMEPDEQMTPRQRHAAAMFRVVLPTETSLLPYPYQVIMSVLDEFRSSIDDGSLPAPKTLQEFRKTFRPLLKKALKPFRELGLSEEIQDRTGKKDLADVIYSMTDFVYRLLSAIHEADEKLRGQHLSCIFGVVRSQSKMMYAKALTAPGTKVDQTFTTVSTAKMILDIILAMPAIGDLKKITELVKERQQSTVDSYNARKKTQSLT